MFVSRTVRRTLFLFAIGAALLWAGGLVAWRAQAVADPFFRLDGVQVERAGLPGFNLDRGELAQPVLGSLLDRLDVAGFRWVRFTLPWDEIEPDAGRFEWTPWDAVFAELARHPDLQPVAVLNGAPGWARSPADADNPQAPPHERAGFGAFAAAVAQRYGAQVRYYQVWHEPNIAPHWGARAVDPVDYGGLLREAAVQIRNTDADARIVLAALAPTTESGGANLSDLAFLDALYSLGAQAWFDVVAVQPYGFAAAPDAAASAQTLNFARVDLLHDVMLRYSDGARPLWATAFGWNALPPGWAGPASPWGLVAEADQARYATQAVESAGRSRPWLGPLFWPAVCPPLAADDPWAGFAVCNADGEPRPVWHALVAAARPRPVLAPGRHPADAPALRYSPGWRVTSAAADPSADGDVLDFSFYGTGLALRMQGGPYWAFYRITVDGEPANALPRDESGAAYLVLHDPAETTRWAPVATGLPLKEHAVRLETTGGWGQWALQGIAVTSEPAPQPLLPWALTGLATLMTLAWAGLAWRLRKIDPRRHAKRHDDIEKGLPGSSWPFADRLFSLLIDCPARLPEAALWAIGVALAGLLVISRWLAVDLLALAGLGWLFVSRPDLCLPLIAASLPFWQQPKRLVRWEFGHFELFLWVAVAALAIRWLLQWVGARGSRGAGGAEGRGVGTDVHSPFAVFDWPILALLFSGLASTLLAAEQGVAWREFRIVFLFGAVFYALITRTPWPAGRSFSWRPLVLGLLGGMVAASLIGLGQLVTGQGRIDVEGVWRVRALYGSPNNLALVLDRGVPLALALAAWGALTSTLHPSKQPNAGDAERGDSAEPGAADRQRSISLGDSSGLRPLRMTGAKNARARGNFLFAAAAVLMIGACVATFSKGALLLGLPTGIAVVLLGGAWRSGRRWPLWALVGLIAIAVAGLALLFRTPRFADLLNFQSGTSFLRLKLWQGAWHMALDHPILGVGPDNFLYTYRTHYVLPSAWEELNLSHPHNILLDLWTRLGLIGVAAGGWALVAAFRAAWRSFRAGRAETWPLALGLLAGLAATVAHGLIDNSLFLPDLMGLFVIATGLLQRDARKCEDVKTS